MNIIVKQPEAGRINVPKVDDDCQNLGQNRLIRLWERTLESPLCLSGKGKMNGPLPRAQSVLFTGMKFQQKGAPEACG